MKFTMNGKKLKEMIETSLLKGKYNEGLTSTKSQLGDVVRISAENDKVLVENADFSTYICISKQATVESEGHISMSATSIVKYLPDETCVFVLSGGVLSVNFGNSVAEVPCAETHTSAHVIQRFSNIAGLSPSERIHNLQVTEKLRLDTRVNVNNQELISALNSAEKVGHSVYTLTNTDEHMTLTSVRDSERFSSNIERYNDCTRDAIVSFSLPIMKALAMGSQINTDIYYDDEMPIVFYNHPVVILRAPRQTN